MRKLLFFIFLGVSLGISLFIALSLSSDNQSMDLTAFNTANNLYITGKYDEAIQIYQNLAVENQSNSVLYFNLGNAYYMNGDKGRALVNYKRALRLDPRDQDIRNNILILQSANNNSVNEHGALRGPVSSLAEMTGQILSINETAMITFCLWFLIFTMILFLRIFRNKQIRVGASAFLMLFVILFIIAGLSLGSRILTEKLYPPAVVTAVEIPLNSQPGETYVTDNYLKNGAEVLLLDTKGEWIKLSNNSNTYQGWVPASSVETVAITFGHPGL